MASHLFAFVFRPLLQIHCEQGYRPRAPKTALRCQADEKAQKLSPYRIHIYYVFFF